MDPVPRAGTSSQQMGLAPCGGRSRGFAHTITEPGSLNPVVWGVKHPALDGNCTVALAPDGVLFDTLFPSDGSADTTGRFPCGRKTTYEETKSFRFPTTLTCDQCVLQWVWETYQGVFYQCADIEVAFLAGNCLGR